MQYGKLIGEAFQIALRNVLCLPAVIVLAAAGAGAAGVVTALVVLPVTLAAAGAVGTFGHGLWTLGYARMVDSPS